MSKLKFNRLWRDCAILYGVDIEKDNRFHNKMSNKQVIEKARKIWINKNTTK